MPSLLECLRAIDDPELLLEKEHIIKSDAHFHVFWKDLSGTYLGANDIQARMLGLEKGHQTIGGSVLDYFVSDTAKAIQDNDRRVINEKSSKIFIEPILTRENKRYTAFSHKKVLLSKTNKVLGSMGFAFLVEEHATVDMTFLLNPFIADAYFSTEKLSKRQIDCLVLLIKGMTFKQIAAELDLSARTVEHYIQNLKAKLSAYSRSDLIAKSMLLPEVRNRL